MFDALNFDAQCGSATRQLGSSRVYGAKFTHQSFFGSRNCPRRGKASSAGDAVVTYCKPSRRSFNNVLDGLCIKD